MVPNVLQNFVKNRLNFDEPFIVLSVVLDTLRHDFEVRGSPMVKFLMLNCFTKPIEDTLIYTPSKNILPIRLKRKIHQIYSWMLIVHSCFSNWALWCQMII